MKKLTSTDKKKVRDAVMCAINELLCNSDKLNSMVWDALDGCANELCYDEEKMDALNDEIGRTMEKVIARIK